MTTLPAGPANVSPEAKAIHDDAIVIDGCTFFFRGNNEMLKEGGVTASNYTTVLPMDDSADAVERIRDVYRALQKDSTSRNIRQVEDIREAKAAGEYGYIIGCQNSRHIGTDLAWIEVFWQLGLRTLQLTYNERNFVGDGCLEPEDAGLSHFGKRAIREANRVGLTIDLSHASRKTCFQAIEHSEKPVMFSHMGIASMVPGARSITDDLAKALGEAGGVLGITTFPRVNWRGDDRRPSLSDFMEALERAIELVGIDHVAIGTDYAAAPKSYPDWVIEYLSETYATYRDGASSSRPGMQAALGGIDIHDEQLEGFAGIHHLPRITEELLKRGYGREDIHKVLGGNFIRLFEATWV
jgi:membrane dipeptidase